MSPISFEGSLVSGVVDQDVDAAEFVDSAPDDGSAVIRVSQVAGNERGLASLLLDECLHFWASSCSLRYAIRMSAPSRA
jgi:hypothetical protein